MPENTSNSIRAGVVVVSKFAHASDKSFAAYISYIDRDNATRNRHYTDYAIGSLKKDLTSAGYLDYMNNPEKTSDLFGANTDIASAEEAQKLKALFSDAQKNGSPMWQTVISFDTRFLSEHSLYDDKTKTLNEAEIKNLTRTYMSKMLQKENLSQSAVYAASIHYNTEHIHVHIAAVEPVPTRPILALKSVTLPSDYVAEHELLAGVKRIRYNVPTKFTSKKGDYGIAFNAAKTHLSETPYNLNLGSYITINDDRSITLSYRGEPEELSPDFVYSEKKVAKGKLSQTAIDSGKSAVVNAILGQSVDTQKINDIIRKNIVANLKNDISRENPEFAKEFVSLLGQLPPDRRLWRYNNNAMLSYRPALNQMCVKYLEHNCPEDYANLKDNLNKADAVYQKAYGGDSTSYSDNKLQELYARMGNTILREMAAFDRSEKHKISSARRAVRSNGYQAAQNAVRPSAAWHLNNALYHIKRGLNADLSSFKNQLRYEELEREAQLSAQDDIYR